VNILRVIFSPQLNTFTTVQGYYGYITKGLPRNNLSNFQLSSSVRNFPDNIE
jgi:hypothetical protein